MGIGDRGILSVGKELETTVLDMIEQLIDEDSAIVSIYYGEDAREDAANAIGEKITGGASGCRGGSPLWRTADLLLRDLRRVRRKSVNNISTGRAAARTSLEAVDGAAAFFLKETEYESEYIHNRDQGNRGKDSRPVPEIKYRNGGGSAASLSEDVCAVPGSKRGGGGHGRRGRRRYSAG